MGGLIPVDGMIVQGEVNWQPGPLTGESRSGSQGAETRWFAAGHRGGRRRVYQAPGVPAERQQPV